MLMFSALSTLHTASSTLPSGLRTVQNPHRPVQLLELHPKRAVLLPQPTCLLRRGRGGGGSRASSAPAPVAPVGPSAPFPSSSSARSMVAPGGVLLLV